MHCASSHNQETENNNLKTKKQPELTENRTVWKSNNQGDKEETFIQTSRRGRDGQLGRRGHTARRRLAEPARWQIVERGAGWAKLQLAGKAATGGPGDRPPNPEFQHGEIKPQTTD